jgi:integrase
MTQAVKLTTKVIEEFDNRGKDTIIWDVSPKGFGVRFYAKGKIAFVVQTRIGSGRRAKIRKMTIGSYPTMGVAFARKEAFTAIAEMQAGNDLVEQERQRIAAELEAKAAELSVGEVCDKWITTDGRRSRMRGAKFGTPRKPKDIQNNVNQIKRHIRPLIGDIKISELTKKDIQRMRDDISEGKTAVDVKTKKRGRARVTGGEGTAAKAVKTLSSALSYAVREGLIGRNPAFGIRLAPDRRVERYLTKAEQATLERALCEMEQESKYEKGCAIIRVLMLTGCRRNEIESLRWSEIDLERGFVSFGKSKTGAKVIPFSRAALEIIEAQPRLSSWDFVFPSLKINDWYKGLPKIWNEVRNRTGLHDVRIHDLRHNFASILASNGASLPMIGAMLGHTQAETTARYAHLTNHTLSDLAEQASMLLKRRGAFD